MEENSKKTGKKGQLIWMYFIGIELAGFFIGDMLTRTGQTAAAQILQIFVPTPLTVEGGIFFCYIGSSFLLFPSFQKENGGYVPGFLSRIVLIFFYRVVCLRHVCLGCFLWYSISVVMVFSSANFMWLQR